MGWHGPKSCYFSISFPLSDDLYDISLHLQFHMVKRGITVLFMRVCHALLLLSLFLFSALFAVVRIRIKGNLPILILNWFSSSKPMCVWEGKYNQIYQKESQRALYTVVVVADVLPFSLLQLDTELSSTWPNIFIVVGCSRKKPTWDYFNCTLYY